MLVDGINTRSIDYNNDYTVSIIDQTLLPHNLEIKVIKNLDDSIIAIKDMMVRGAPLIGVTASYGMTLAIKDNPSDENIYSAFEKLVNTRPTAVDLKWALENLMKKILPINKNDRFDYSWQLSKSLLEDSVQQCSDIGEHGLNLIKNIKKK